MRVHCRGQENAQPADAIGAALGIAGSDRGRVVRSLISTWHDRLPIPIAGNPGDGFFVAERPEEIEHYDAVLYSIVKSAAMRLAKARRCFARCGFERLSNAPQARYTRR
jgi:hypothetical protein